jgi:YidC/Oxa1 family membrane protein insertase
MFDFVFNTFILYPMLNVLLWLYGLLGSNFILAIVIFTLFTRLIVLPLTIQQQRNTQKMAALQPQLQEIQKKYKDDPQKLQEEMARIGYGPGMLAGGCLPTIVQLVILIGLWQAITRVLATSPLQLLDLAQATYKFIPGLLTYLPVQHTFLWLDLSHYDPTYVLPVLVAVSTYFSQKAFSPTMSGDATSAQMTRQMQLMMPVMLGWMALNFPSALSIYWVISNLLAVVQYYGLQRSGLVPAPVAAGSRPTGGAGGGKSPSPPPPPPAPTAKPTSRARKVRTKK